MALVSCSTIFSLGTVANTVVLVIPKAGEKISTLMVVPTSKATTVFKLSFWSEVEARMPVLNNISPISIKRKRNAFISQIYKFYFVSPNLISSFGNFGSESG